MPTWKTTVPILVFLCVAAIFQHRSPFLDEARAQEPSGPTAVVDRAPLQLKCRIFPVLLDSDVTFESANGTTDAGQWIAAQDGWALHSVDFEVGQKSTGFPRGFRQVCLHRA
jgi:hypothetical protein